MNGIDVSVIRSSGPKIMDYTKRGSTTSVYDIMFQIDKTLNLLMEDYIIETHKLKQKPRKRKGLK